MTEHITARTPLVCSDERHAAKVAALEAELKRVTALYEQWVKAGPPPLGTPIARWWDKRLAELHHAIRPPAQEPTP